MPQKSRPSRNEVDYFTREELEKIHRLHAQREEQAKHLSDEDKKRLHFGSCSRCGNKLSHGTYKLIEADHCPSCDAIVISKSDMEKLVLAGRSILEPFLEIFGSNDK